MTAISATLVKSLREQTGAGMMDCKKALQACAGDIEAATDWLRKQGIAKAAGKSNRATSEGAIAIAVAGGAGAMVEINCETDFVARSEQFISSLQNIAKAALQQEGKMEAILAAPFAGGKGTVGEQLSMLTSTLGENMTFRRADAISVGGGFVASYVHNALGEGVGLVGVLVGIKTNQPDNSSVTALGKQVAMHVAAANPAALNVDDLDAALVEKEKEVLREQAAKTGKPANIVEKMLQGRLNKFYAETVLLRQPFVMDDSKSVGKAIEEVAQQQQAEISLTGFRRWVLGSQPN